VIILPSIVCGNRDPSYLTLLGLRWFPPAQHRSHRAPLSLKSLKASHLRLAFFVPGRGKMG